MLKLLYLSTAYQTTHNITQKPSTTSQQPPQHLNLQPLENHMTDIETLRAQAAANRAAKLLALAEQAEVSQLTNTALQDRIAEQEFTDSQLNKLRSLVTTFRSYYELIPTRNAEGVVRKAPTTRLFNQGEQLDLLTQVCALVLYAPASHKLLIDTQVSLSTTLVEQFLSSLGRTAYVSRDGSVVEEIPADFTTAKSTADLLFVQLGVLLDSSSMNETRMLESFVRANNQAITQLAKNATMQTDEEAAALFTM